MNKPQAATIATPEARFIETMVGHIQAEASEYNDFIKLVQNAKTTEQVQTKVLFLKNEVLRKHPMFAKLSITVDGKNVSVEDIRKQDEVLGLVIFKADRRLNEYAKIARNVIKNDNKVSDLIDQPKSFGEAQGDDTKGADQTPTKTTETSSEKLEGVLSVVTAITAGKLTAKDKQVIRAIQEVLEKAVI